MQRVFGALRIPINELVRYYLRLGALGFGGPAALVAQMEQDLVRNRQWVSTEEFREAVAICQSLPGPLAIQVGIFISCLRGGFWGAWAGGLAFIFPNFVIVAVLGALFVRVGDLPLFRVIFYGVSPAVIALIAYSCYRLTKLGMDDVVQWLIAAVCFAVTVVLRAEIALLFVGSGILGILYYAVVRQRKSLPLPFLAAIPLVSSGQEAAARILLRLLTFFLKAGALTFGSGLVIVPFLEKGLVQQTGWLDERQFLVAPILIRHHANRNVQGFVKGAYAAAIGTILGACILLGKIAIGDWLTVLIALLSLVVLFRWNVNNPALVATAAIIGLIAFPLLQPTWVFVK